MKEGRTINVGVLGAGNFANMQHLPHLKRIDNVNVVAICDVDEEKARRPAADFEIPTVYTD